MKFFTGAAQGFHRASSRISSARLQAKESSSRLMVRFKSLSVRRSVSIL
jgi:hypothetical protein